MTEFEAGGHYLKDPSGEDVEPKQELPAPSACRGDLDMGKVTSDFIELLDLCAASTALGPISAHPSDDVIARCMRESDERRHRCALCRCGATRSQEP
jgi:hypothetical protein